MDLTVGIVARVESFDVTCPMTYTVPARGSPPPVAMAPAVQEVGFPRELDSSNTGILTPKTIQIDIQLTEDISKIPTDTSYYLRLSIDRREHVKLDFIPSQRGRLDGFS